MGEAGLSLQDCEALVSGNSDKVISDFVPERESTVNMMLVETSTEVTAT